MLKKSGRRFQRHFMDRHNLFVGKWFKLPPKAGEKTMTVIIKERGHGKKSRKGSAQKKGKKRG